MTDECISPRPSKRLQIATEICGPRQAIVVGGGLAGIAAALTLSDSGYRVTLLEARSRLGGRVGSFEDPVSGQAIDYCQHVGMACCTNLIQFLKLLGIERAWDRQTTLHFFSRHGVHLPLRAAPFPAPLHLSGLLLRWPELRWRDRCQIAQGLFRMMRLKPSADLDQTLAIDWLRFNGQSSTAISNFWATILVSALGEQIDRVTLGATRKVLIDGFAANRSAYHLLVPQQPLSRLIGAKAEEVIAASGVSVRLSSPVKGLCWRAQQCRGVELTDRSVLDADHVVVAVPWHQLHRLLNANCPSAPDRVGAWIDKTNALESAPITGIHTWWDRAWLDPPHAILVDRLCQWVFGDPNQQAATAGEYYYQIVISGSRNLPRGEPAATLEAVVKDLRDIFPKAVHARLIRGKVVTDPKAVFSVAKGHQLDRPCGDLFAEQKLWLCGDWTNTGWPATMEGAIRSGFSTGEAIAHQDGCTVRWIAEGLPHGWLARRLVRR